VETRLSAIGAARTRTFDALKAAERRADAAVQERDALAAALEEARSTPTPDPELAHKLDAAAERIRALELQLFWRDRDPRTRDVNLTPLLPTDPAHASELAGKQATRYNFKPATKVKIDNQPAVLVDLSVTGAQVVCAQAPEVGRIVTFTLMGDETPSFCQGRFLWARREQLAKGKPFRFRAGLVFTDADEAAIMDFIEKHAVK
jgi:PilZ domain-containing protein